MTVERCLPAAARAVSGSGDCPSGPNGALQSHPDIEAAVVLGLKTQSPDSGVVRVGGSRGRDPFLGGHRKKFLTHWICGLSKVTLRFSYAL